MPSVPCPTCGRTVEWVETSRWRPFCSERCKLIDLGKWLDGKYQIPVEPDDQDEQPYDELPPQAPPGR